MIDELIYAMLNVDVPEGYRVGQLAAVEIVAPEPVGWSVVFGVASASGDLFRWDSFIPRHRVTDDGDSVAVASQVTSDLQAQVDRVAAGDQAPIIARPLIVLPGGDRRPQEG